MRQRAADKAVLAGDGTKEAIRKYKKIVRVG